MPKHLVINANPSHTNFTYSVLTSVMDLLSGERGHEVALRDLYAMKFKPTLDSADFDLMMQGNLPSDILAEQAAIKNADYITIISPLWWGGMPAILKGYIERVFTYDFAYKFGDDPMHPIGLLSDKKVMLLTVIGGPDELYKQHGMYEALRETWDWAIFEFCGMRVLGHMYFPDIHYTDDKKRHGYLETMKAQMRLLTD